MSDFVVITVGLIPAIPLKYLVLTANKNVCSVCKRPFMTNRNPYILLGLCFGIYSRFSEVESQKVPSAL